MKTINATKADKIKSRPANRSKFQPNGVPARLTKLARRTEKKLGRD